MKYGGGEKARRLHSRLLTLFFSELNKKVTVATNSQLDRFSRAEVPHMRSVEPHVG